MSAKLLNHTPLSIVAYAARTCTGTSDKTKITGDDITNEDKRIISDRILRQNIQEKIQKRITESNDIEYIKQQLKLLYEPKHESVIEHAVYTFELKFSRSVLQELARHRIASLSVESTRYALKRILDQSTNVRDCLKQSGNMLVDQCNLIQMVNIIDIVKANIPNDEMKYMLPEAFITRMVWTINARSLRNFFTLRMSKRALKEIRDLAWEIYMCLPNEHKFIFDDVLGDKDV